MQKTTDNTEMDKLICRGNISNFRKLLDEPNYKARIATNQLLIEELFKLKQLESKSHWFFHAHG
jgi:hypothetical protein